MRRATARSAMVVPRISSMWVGTLRSRAHRSARAGELSPRSFARRFSGAVVTNRLQVVDRLGASPYRAFTCTQNRSDGFASASRTQLGEFPAGEVLTCRPGCVEFIVLRAVSSCRAFRSVDLKDPFALLDQIGGQPAAIPASTFDGPDTGAGCATLRQGVHPQVSRRIGGQLKRVELHPACIDDRCGVGVLVGIDSDHEMWARGTRVWAGGGLRANVVHGLSTRPEGRARRSIRTRPHIHRALAHDDVSLSCILLLTIDAPRSSLKVSSGCTFEKISAKLISDACRGGRMASPTTRLPLNLVPARSRTRQCRDATSPLSRT